MSEPTIVTLNRTEIVDLCKRLGHDPGKVGQILITPTTVEVTYYHPVSEGAVEHELEGEQ